MRERSSIDTSILKDWNKIKGGDGLTLNINTFMHTDFSTGACGQGSTILIEENVYPSNKPGRETAPQCLNNSTEMALLGHTPLLRLKSVISLVFTLMAFCTIKWT